METGYIHEKFSSLVDDAKTYDVNDAELFISEIGWQSEWMLDFVENPEKEMLSIHDARRINEILIEAFEMAHKIKFSPCERNHLLNY